VKVARTTNESPHKSGTAIHNKPINKCMKVGRKPARRRETQASITKTAESKTKHKHAHEGTQHSAGEMKINTIVA
jgi:hypothetical protein